MPRLTEILDRREASGTVAITRCDVVLDEDGEKWNRDDRRLLRSFLLSCFKADRMVDQATADVGDRHGRRFSLRVDEDGMRVTLVRKMRLNSMWRGFFRAQVELVESTRV